MATPDMYPKVNRDKTVYGKEEDGLVGHVGGRPNVGSWQPEGGFDQDPFTNYPMLTLGSADGAESQWLPGTLLFMVPEAHRVAYQVMDLATLLSWIARDKNLKVMGRGMDDGPPEHVAKRRKIDESDIPFALDSFDGIADAVALIGTAGDTPEPVGLYGPGGNGYDQMVSATGIEVKVQAVRHFGTQQFPRLTKGEIKPNFHLYMIVKEVEARHRPDFNALRSASGVNIGRILCPPTELIPHIIFVALPPNEKPVLWSNPKDARTPGRQPPLTDVGFWQTVVDSTGAPTGRFRRRAGRVTHVGVFKDFDAQSPVDAAAVLTSTAETAALPTVRLDMRLTPIPY